MYIHISMEMDDPGMKMQLGPLFWPLLMPKLLPQCCILSINLQKQPLGLINRIYWLQYGERGADFFFNYPYFFIGPRCLLHFKLIIERGGKMYEWRS